MNKEIYDAMEELIEVRKIFKYLDEYGDKFKWIRSLCDQAAGHAMELEDFIIDSIRRGR